MPAFHGKDLVFTWIWSGGTIAANTYYRSVDWNPSGELFDQTAGADTHKTYIPGVKDSTVNFAGLSQAGGTVLSTAFAVNNGGTIIISPEGTATGKRKITVPAYSQGAKETWPYDNVCEISCSFQGNGAWTDANW